MSYSILQADLLRLHESTSKAQAQELEGYKASTAKLQKALQVPLRLHMSPSQCPAAQAPSIALLQALFWPSAEHRHGVRGSYARLQLTDSDTATQMRSARASVSSCHPINHQPPIAACLGRRRNASA